MDFDKPIREGDTCRGVIKKLFPSKRYGFAVCECAEHTGEAHFNYSDLDLPEQERSCLLVGWRIEFNVVEQHKKTDHCDYRAIKVKPVNVMVVHCEVTKILDNEIAVLTCRELTGKTIYVTRSKYNGKFEPEAVTRRDTCRAAVTWEQMKSKKTFAEHCSQDTVSSTAESPYRPKFKTPERRLGQSEGNTFSESLISCYSAPYGPQTYSGNGNQYYSTRSRAVNDSGLLSPENHRSASSCASRNFGANAIRVLNTTSTPKCDSGGHTFESGRFSPSGKTSPQTLDLLKPHRAESLSSSGIPFRFCSTSLGRGNISPEDLRESDSFMNQLDSRDRSNGGTQSLRSSISPVDNTEDHRYGASRRNLDKEYELLCGNASILRTPKTMSSIGSLYTDSAGLMPLPALSEQDCFNGRSFSSPVEQRRYPLDSGLGLYDCDIDTYSSAGNQQQFPFRSTWEMKPEKTSPRPQQNNTI